MIYRFKPQKFKISWFGPNKNVICYFLNWNMSNLQILTALINIFTPVNFVFVSILFYGKQILFIIKVQFWTHQKYSHIPPYLGNESHCFRIYEMVVKHLLKSVVVDVNMLFLHFVSCILNVVTFWFTVLLNLNKNTTF